MPRKKGSPDVAPMIRGAFKRAVAQLENEGKPLSELIKKSLEENLRDTLRAVGSFTPKELEVTRKPSKLEEMSDDELEQLASLATSVLSESGDSEEGDGTAQLNSLH